MVYTFFVVNLLEGPLQKNMLHVSVNQEMGCLELQSVLYDMALPAYSGESRLL